MKNGKIKLGRYIIEPKTSIDILNADEFNVIKFNTGKVYISKEPMELNKEKFWTTIFCDNKIISKVELSNAEEKYKMNYQTMNDNILKDIKRPFTAIMGGSKVSTKIGIIENLMDKVDNLILCGGMTYTFAKAQGGKIGNSIVEDDKLDLALDIIAKAKAKGVNLVLGSDCVAADAFSNDAHTQVVPANNIPDGWEGLDAGPETQKAFAAAIEDAKTILWNGPAGVFEFDNFTAGSRAIAEAIAKATKNGAFSLIGGGDSVACINKFGMADQVSYISTGGGALLEAIEGKILPGVAAIKGE